MLSTVRHTLFSALLLTASAVAFAGDCLLHPVTLIELEVISCAPLDAPNATHVVPIDRLMRNHGVPKAQLDAEVANLVAERSAVVLEVETRRARTIQIDSPDRAQIEPQAEDWKAYAKTTWLLLRTKEAGVCRRLFPRVVTVLAHPTDCSCDTGPHGWCVVDRETIVTLVPEYLAKYGR